jgi:nitrogen fixation NifU-like protein
MNGDLRDLYQEVILEHARKPRNYRVIATPEVRHGQGFNRLCGDRLNLYLEIVDGTVRDASFQGSGCAISTASASMMTQAVKGRTVAEAEALFRRFHALVTGQDANGDADVDLGKLAVFGGVRDYPARVKCASLAWHTMHAALVSASNEVVSTEE